MLEGGGSSQRRRTLFSIGFLAILTSVKGERGGRSSERRRGGGGGSLETVKKGGGRKGGVELEASDRVRSDGVEDWVGALSERS